MRPAVLDLQEQQNVLLHLSLDNLQHHQHEPDALAGNGPASSIFQRTFVGWAAGRIKKSQLLNYAIHLLEGCCNELYVMVTFSDVVLVFLQVV